LLSCGSREACCPWPSIDFRLFCVRSIKPGGGAVWAAHRFGMAIEFSRRGRDACLVDHHDDRGSPQPIPSPLHFCASLGGKPVGCGGNSSHGLRRHYCFVVRRGSPFGLVMEKEKKQHADGVIITRLVRKTLHESSLRANIANTLKLLREHFNADQVGLVIQEIKGEQTFFWEASRPTPTHEDEVKSWNLTGPEREASFAMMPEEVCRLLGLRRIGGDP